MTAEQYLESRLNQLYCGPPPTWDRVDVDREIRMAFEAGEHDGTVTALRAITDFADAMKQRAVRLDQERRR